MPSVHQHTSHGHGRLFARPETKKSGLEIIARKLERSSSPVGLRAVLKPRLLEWRTRADS